MKISYGLTVCDEHEEIRNLIQFLVKRIDREDEIIVVYDQNRVTDEVRAIFDLYRHEVKAYPCLLYTSPSPRDKRQSRMPSSA